MSNLLFYLENLRLFGIRCHVEMVRETSQIIEFNLVVNGKIIGRLIYHLGLQDWFLQENKGRLHKLEGTKEITTLILKENAKSREEMNTMPKIKNVIFNYPATIVFWEDGSKTVVKCGGDDVYDKEKGLAMAIVKKMSGNKGNFNDVFKKWCYNNE
jgi:hypothetical protein